MDFVLKLLIWPYLGTICVLSWFLASFVFFFLPLPPMSSMLKSLMQGGKKCATRKASQCARAARPEAQHSQGDD